MTAQSNEPGLVGGEPPEAFNLDVRAHGLSLTDALKEYASGHLVAKLVKHARQIQSVMIRLVDVNGTKGGEDKTCEVEVFVRAQEPIVVSATNHDLRAAIDEAADRVQVALGRELERARALPRQRGRKVVRARKMLS